MQFANCRGQKASIFVPDPSQTTAQAQKFCRNCPAIKACEDYGRRTGSVGVFGGVYFSLGGEERQVLPIRKLLDFRPRPVAETERKRMPAILGGQAANFRRDTGITGSASQAQKAV